MGRRAASALTALLVLVAGGCEAEPERETVADGLIPVEWLVAADSGASGTALVWVFRTDDCLTCQSFDYAVRRLQAEHGDSIPFVAVHVGSRAREQVPRSFFRSRRITVARLTTLSPGALRRTYREEALPALLVVHGRRIVWTSALPQGVSTAAQVDSIVRGVRREVRAGGESRSGR